MKFDLIIYAFIPLTISTWSFATLIIVTCHKKENWYDSNKIEKRCTCVIHTSDFAIKFQLHKNYSMQQTKGFLIIIIIMIHYNNYIIVSIYILKLIKYRCPNYFKGTCIKHNNFWEHVCALAYAVFICLFQGNMRGKFL